MRMSSTRGASMASEEITRQDLDASQLRAAAARTANAKQVRRKAVLFRADPTAKGPRKTPAISSSGSG
jgi:hypothetical protein